MLKYGHGYDNPTLPGRTPCTAFDGFDVIASPLGGTDNEGRAKRSGWPVGWSASTKVTYDSHAVKLGRAASERDMDCGGRSSGTLAVMMQHGGGRQLTPLRICQERAAIEAGLLAMPESALYFLLYAISETADKARQQGVEQERFRWLRAGEEGRIRKRRPKGGKPGYMDVFEPYEMPRKRA